MFSLQRIQQPDAVFQSGWSQASWIPQFMIQIMETKSKGNVHVQSKISLQHKPNLGYQ